MHKSAKTFPQNWLLLKQRNPHCKSVFRVGVRVKLELGIWLIRDGDNVRLELGFGLVRGC